MPVPSGTTESGLQPNFLSPAPFLHFCFFGSLLRGAKMSPLLPAFIPAQARFAANVRSRKVLPLAGGRAESAFARWRVPANFKFAARLAFWRRRGLLRNGFLRRRALFAEFAKKWSGPPRAGGFSAITPSGRGDCAPRGREVSRFGKTPSYCPMSLERASE